MVKPICDTSWQEEPKVLTFPKHFDVRFAEHVLNVLKDVFINLWRARNVWTVMSNGTINTDDAEKSMAQGFLRKLKKSTQQVNKCNRCVKWYYYHGF